MYKWSITPETNENLLRIAELRSMLNQDTLPRRWANRLRRELEVASTAASTSMGGIPVSVDAVRRILAGDKPQEVSEDEARAVQGYHAATVFVLRRADDPSFRWQTELILGIHDRIFSGSPAAKAGRIRSGQVFISLTSESQSMYEPPMAKTVRKLVDELAAYAKKEESNIPAPVLSALVHVGFSGIHPFSDGNGRTARVLASLAMYRGGYTGAEFTNLEEWWGSHRAEYNAAFECLGASWNPNADVTPFVTAHVKAHRQQVEELVVRENIQRNLWTLLEDIVTEDLGLSPRFTDALFDAFYGRNITNRYYRGLAAVSTATATNHLAQLEMSGLLQSQGAGRTRSYTGSLALIKQVAATGKLGDLPSDSPLDIQRQWILARLGQRIEQAAQ